MFMSDWSPLMTPQKVTLDSMCTLSFVSNRQLSSQIQVSMSAAVLDIYLYESSNNMLYRTVH